MSMEELSSIFESLTTIKEFCLCSKDCSTCPFANSYICKTSKPKDWILNDPTKPAFRFF